MMTIYFRAMPYLEDPVILVRQLDEFGGKPPRVHSEQILKQGIPTYMHNLFTCLVSYLFITNNHDDVGNL